MCDEAGWHDGTLSVRGSPPVGDSQCAGVYATGYSDSESGKHSPPDKGWSAEAGWFGGPLVPAGTSAPLATSPLDLRSPTPILKPEVPPCSA